MAAIKRISLRHAATLGGLRYTPANAAAVEKVGILPYRRLPGGGLEFLLHAPMPKYDKDKVLPFGIARGTLQMEQLVDGERRMVDVGPGQRDGVVESFEQAALREGAEELGISAQGVRQLANCGPLAYKDYGIHFFLAEMSPDAALLPPIDASGVRQSRDVRWIGLDQAETMTATKEFNSGYLPLLRSLASTVEQYLPPPSVSRS